MAGKRAGLDGERSGLYMEQIRIVKEMREQDERNGRTDDSIRPRYMVWENVPGAFSSNKGEDFRIVLEELAKVKDKDAVIPMPDKGKWTNYGYIVGKGYSIAWRVLDSQWWGVPQRRRRIVLIADFNGYSAQRIIFNEIEHNGSTESSNRESSVTDFGGQSQSQVQPLGKSVSRDTGESKPKRKATPSDASRGIGADDCIGVKCLTPWDTQTRRVYDANFTYPSLCAGENSGQNQQSILIKADAYTLKIRSGCEGGGKGALVQTEKSATLSCNNDQYLFQPVYSVENHPNDSRVGINEDGMVQALTGRMGTGGGNVPLVYALDREAYNSGQNFARTPGIYEDDIAPTMVSRGPGAVCYSVDQGGGKSSVDIREGKAPTLTTTHGGAPAVCYADGNYIDVEMEVEVRKYPVDCKLLCECLRDHKAASNFSNKDIAETLDVPLTKVEHWFRQDKSFAIPDPDIWFDLKKLLGISTDEFDKEIMTFECKGGNYDLRNRIYSSSTSPTLTCGSGNNLYLLPNEVAVDCQNGTESEVNGVLQSNSAHSLNGNNVVRCRYIVRRLTPLECERLQGYPDGWTDIGEWTDTKGKRCKTSDAARYKALGNSIALPPWKWVLKRLCACYERDATMASLFDGIGGFPYLWEQLNGKGTCLWASEIEEFPIAVTKVRIGE